jgi:hypothetical protein
VTKLCRHRSRRRPARARDASRTVLRARRRLDWPRRTRSSLRGGRYLAGRSGLLWGLRFDWNLSCSDPPPPLAWSEMTRPVSGAGPATVRL